MYFKKGVADPAGGFIKMKKITSLAVFLIAFSFPAISSADSVFPLGDVHFELTTGSALYTDSNVDDLGIDDGTFFGTAVYVSVSPRLYLGLEVSRVEETGRFGNGNKIELEFMPVEVNLKYTNAVNDNLVLSLGGGISKTSIEEKITTVGSSTRRGWQHGLQAFAGLDLIVDAFFLGFDVKWQTMDDFKASSYDYNNIRLGFRLGMMF